MQQSPVEPRVMWHVREWVNNPRSERVKRLSQLKNARARQRRRQFFVEGPRAVREALRAHRLPAPGGLTADNPVQALYVSEAAMERFPDILELATDADLPLFGASERVLAALVSTEHPQGVVGLCQWVDVPLAQALTPGVQLVAVAVGVQDPGNAGTLIRVADAAGAQAVIFTHGSVDVYNPKVVRSTVGSLFHLPIVTHVSLDALIPLAHERRLQVFAADASGESIDDVTDRQCAAATMWLFGNEAHGLGLRERQLADRCVAVPLYGRAESLNVGTAAAVCLYTSARASRA